MKPLDRVALEKLRRIAPSQLAARRDADWRARPLPEEIALKLTNRCDLRCTHCYQWKDVGYHHHLPLVEKQHDLPLELIDEVLAATRDLRSNLYLWGGEPLVYRHWDGLVERLAADPRWTTICTNGTLVERRLPSLLPLSAQLEMSISIDGFQAEHDALRGEGAFARTMGGLRALVEEKRFDGEISVNCVIGDALVPRLFELVEFFQSEGVDSLHLSLPWHISPSTAAKMDDCFAERFPERPRPAQPSWRSFDHRLDLAHLDELRRQLARIAAARWQLKLRYNPALTDAELEPFLLGSDVPAQGKTRCLALKSRLEVFPNGDVVSCKFFPEFTVGNLHRSTLAEAWHGQAYDQVRESVATRGLMPVCAKCNLLYSRGA
jgi:radical SAM protein with 4Fe4S-binding SPASM domain